MSTAAPDKSIYARRVPGINENSLLFAMQNEQKDNEAHINESLNQTSPVVYQHMQRVANQQSRQQTLQTPAQLERQQQQMHDEAIAARAAQLASNAPTLASLANTVRAGVASTEESLEKVRRRVFALDERLREHQSDVESDTKKIMKRNECLHTTACATLVLVALIGLAVLALLIALVVLLVKHMKNVARPVNSTATVASMPVVAAASSIPEQQANLFA